MDDKKQFISKEKMTILEGELRRLKEATIPEIAKRIDDAKQMGDLSENAEYHQAREDLAWAQGRAREIQYILTNAEVIGELAAGSGFVGIGSTLVARANGVNKEYTIVGHQEADPAKGRISNESPLGEAFMGKRAGESVSVRVPAGLQVYDILEIK